MKYISAAEAHRELVKAGIGGSYPTALKWFEKEKLSVQPSGKYGGILVDRERLMKAIEKRKQNAA